MDEGHEFYRSDPVLAACPKKPPDRQLEAMCEEERAYFAEVGDYYYGLRVNPWPLFAEAWARVRGTFLDGAVLEPRPENPDKEWLIAEREALALLLRVTVCRCDTPEWMALYGAMQENMAGYAEAMARKLGLADVDEAVARFFQRHFEQGRHLPAEIGGNADVLSWLMRFSPPGFWKYLPSGYYSAYLDFVLPHRLIDIRRSEEAKRRRETLMTEHIQAVIAAQNDVEADAFAMADQQMIQMEHLFEEITEEMNGLRVNPEFVRMCVREIKAKCAEDERGLRAKSGEKANGQVDEAVRKLRKKANAKIIVYHELLAEHQHFTDVLREANVKAQQRIGGDAKITQYTMYKMYFCAMDLFVLEAIDRGFPKTLLKFYLQHVRHRDHDAPREKGVKARMNELMEQLDIETGNGSR